MTGELFVVQKDSLSGQLTVRYLIKKTWYQVEIRDSDEICIGPEIIESKFVEGSLTAWVQPQESL